MKALWQTLQKHEGPSTAGLLLIITLFFMIQVLLPASDQVLGAHDMRGAHWTWLVYARSALADGRLPFWDPYLYSGYPFLSNPEVAFFYPPTWLAFLLPLTVGISWITALHVWLAGLGMWLFVRRMGGSWLGATLAALTFAFGGFMAARIWAGHLALLAVHVWIPWILLATHWATQRGDIWSGMIAGIPFGLAILAGHTSSLVYVTLIWGVFGLYVALTESKWGLTIRQMGLAVLIGLALSMIQTAAVVELISDSTRSSGDLLERFGSRWSLPPHQLITLLIPNFFGEPVQIGYWGAENFEDLTYYVGLLPLIAALIALRRLNWLNGFYLVLGVLGLLLAVGAYGFLYPLLYNLLPPFQLIRAPARGAFLFVFAASGLVGSVISTLGSESSDAETVRPDHVLNAMMTIAVLGGMVGFTASGIGFASFHPSEAGGRFWHQSGGWILAVVLLVIAGMLLRRRWSHYGRTRVAWALNLSLIGFVLTDLWLFGFKLIRLEPAAPDPLWVQTHEIIGETEARVLPWAVGPFWIHDDPSLVGVHSTLGYSSLEIGAYSDLIYTNNDPRSIAYDILSARYVLSQGPLDTRFTAGPSGMILDSMSDTVWVYERPHALSVARFVYRVEVIDDSALALSRFFANDFDPTVSSILNQTPDCILSETDSTGSATIAEHSPEYWRIETVNNTDALLVLSESAYPGWRVWVDGNPATLLTAYTVIQAVCVPAGAHTIEWRFQPTIFTTGGIVTLSALLLVGLASWLTLRNRTGHVRRE